MLTQIKNVDIFVIGGGINGCGIARDAVGRGYAAAKTALFTYKVTWS